METKYLIAVALVIGLLVGAGIGYVVKPVPVPPELAELKARVSELEAGIADRDVRIRDLEGTISKLEAELAAIPSKPGAGMRIDFVGNGRAVCPWWAKAKAGWDHIAGILGFDNPIYWGEEDPATEAACFDAAIAARPDAILLSNVFWDVLSPKIAEARALGIPVYQIFVVDPAYEAIAPGCGVDLGKQYESLAKFIAPQIKEKFPGKKISVMFAAMTIDTAYAILRRECFIEGLKAEGIEFEYDLLDTAEDPAALLEDLKMYLLGHPELDLYVGLDAETTNRIGPAQRELGYSPGQILVVGCDVLEHSADACADGYIQAIAEQGQYAITQIAALQLFLWTKYGFPPQSMVLPGAIVTAETVDLFR